MFFFDTKKNPDPMDPTKMVQKPRGFSLASSCPDFIRESTFEVEVYGELKRRFDQKLNEQKSGYLQERILNMYIYICYMYVY